MKELKFFYSVKLSLLLFLISCSSDKEPQVSQSEFEYHYTVNLDNYKNDRLSIQLKVRGVSADTLQFCFPKIIPGIYSFANYGKMVQKIEFKDSSGKSLNTESIDENRWNIYNADKLKYIDYTINDGWEKFRPKKGVRKYFMTESMFQDDLFIMNNNSLFGYFKGYENSAYTISVTRQENLYASTSLPYKRHNTTDTFHAQSYYDLIDNPVMYSVPDTTSFSLPEIKVQVAGYTSTGQKISTELAAFIKPLMKNQAKYLGGDLPVKNYTFLVYDDIRDVSKQHSQGLEHKSSTLILLHVPIDSLKKNVYGIASHEFFHILMPIGIHSQEIANYDFQNPKFSKHLWLYEGMTEYFTIHMPVKNHLINLEDFLKEIEGKYQGMQKFDKNLSFVDLSSNSMKYDAQYTNVYQKGPLLNLCLDITLRELSGGNYGVQNLVFDLLDRYGPDKAFKDDELFEEIIQITGYSELREFFDNYIIHSEELPLEETLYKVGIKFKNGHATLSSHPTEAQLALRKAWIDQ